MSSDPWVTARARAVLAGEQLRQARETAGHSLVQACRAVDLDVVNAPTWCLVERGQRIPTTGQAAVLAEYVLQHHESPETTVYAPTPAAPSGARTTDPDTSHAAARSVSVENASRLHWALLDLLARWDDIREKRHPDADPPPLVPTHEAIRILYDLHRMTAFCDDCDDTPDVTKWPRTCDHGWPMTSDSGLRSRLSEMTVKHMAVPWVEDSGWRTPNGNGRATVVWRLTDAGRTAWHQHQEISK